MDFKKICKIAYQYFDNSFGIKGISTIRDIGESYFFEPKSSGQNINYAINPILISKENKVISIFDPSIENLKLLMNGIEIIIPEEYK